MRCGEAEALASIEVRREREFPDPVPPTELEFERARYQVAHGRRRSLLLHAPVEVINEADSTIVRIASLDSGIVVIGGQLKLEFDEDELCFTGRVPVEGRVLGARGTLTATLGGAHAACEVIVAQNDGGGPRLDIRIVDEAQGRYRAYVERVSEITTIKILGGHAAIKRYLGPGREFPNQDTPMARLVVAEIVAAEAARLVMERKYRTTGDREGPAFYAEHLLYLEKYLPRCHKMTLVEGGEGTG